MFSPIMDEAVFSGKNIKLQENLKGQHASDKVVVGLLNSI